MPIITAPASSGNTRLSHSWTIVSTSCLCCVRSCETALVDLYDLPLSTCRATGSEKRLHAARFLPIMDLVQEFGRKENQMSKDIAKALRQLEYGVYIVSMGQGQEGNAFTASWVSQVGSEPPMVAIAVHNKHQSTPRLKEHGAFVVNMLADNQKEFAKTYYGPAESGYQKLASAHVKDAPGTGTAMIQGAIGFLDCKIVNSVPVGNHTLYIGEVQAGQVEGGQKLLTKSNSGLEYTG